jgi:hypothetical protein
VTLNISTGVQKVHTHEEFINVDDLYEGSMLVSRAVRDFKDFR